MNKKAIAILGAIFLLIVGTLGFLIFSKSSSKNNTGNNQLEPPQTQANNQNQNPIPNPPPSQVNTSTPPVATSTPPITNPNPQTQRTPVKLTEETVVSPALFYDGSAVAYFGTQGSLYQAVLDQTGDTITLSRKHTIDIPAKSNISRILWPKKGSDLIAEFVNSGKKTWSYFNSKTGSYTDLPSQIFSLDWMPSGDKILYTWLENGKTTLNISDPDSTHWQGVADMWENDDALSVSPDGLNVLYYRTANPAADNPIYMVSIDGKVWRTLVKTGYNFGVSWSPDGQKFIYSKRDPSNQKPGLWYYNLATGETKSLNVPGTADKLVWDSASKYVYAASPTSGDVQNGLTVDTFSRIDTDTLEQKNYDLGGVNVDFRDMFLNLAGSVLYFRNAQDGALYYLNLN